MSTEATSTNSQRHIDVYIIIYLQIHIVVCLHISTDIYCDQFQNKVPCRLVTQLYTRNLTQPYTRKLTQLYTRKQLSHTCEINSAIHVKSTQPYTGQDICFGHVFDDHMFAVCYDMSTVSRVQACSALGSCRPRALRCHASVTRFYFAIGHVPRLPVS